MPRALQVKGSVSAKVLGPGNARRVLSKGTCRGRRGGREVGRGLPAELMHRPGSQ